MTLTAAGVRIVRGVLAGFGLCVLTYRADVMCAVRRRRTGSGRLAENCKIELEEKMTGCAERGEGLECIVRARVVRVSGLGDAA